ncbi:nuclear transport factor 2 family protein [Streptomyces sp. TLI_146]|uniref:nuclear transport factor 2 family protein n=1 Tax=Streptomyces sp. TLI_146 TaxID=1938858 RepID=UPI000C6FDFBA|nr:nuclear transport factor 2 family protein [Streptomyces sp. TLI_146]PKV88920.1 Mce-associated membrane protein [Streptomyces sp. TLI_146]
MSTTRHLVNRQRRLAAQRPPAQQPSAQRPPDPVRRRRPTAPAARPATSLLSRPLLLTALAVLLAAFSVLAYVQGGRQDTAGSNTALSDTAHTGEVKGAVDDAVQGIFSYDHTDPARTEAAAARRLTGAAVGQYRTLMGPVREQGPGQKLVLTTTVTDSGVEVIDGDRARVLVFADQSSTRTGKDGGTTVAAAMFAVDAVRRGGIWRIASLDTFQRAPGTPTGQGKE